MVHKYTMILYSAIFIILTFFTHCENSKSNSPLEKKTAVILNELSKKYAKLGSFKVRYQILAPEKGGNILIISNHNLKYTLIKFEKINKRDLSLKFIINVCRQCQKV